MSDSPFRVDVPTWVEKAKANPVGYQQRQAIEITLTAISIAVELNQKLYLKGGILMGLAYASPRQTTDIDLTTAFEVDGLIDAKIVMLLNEKLTPAAAMLGYTNLALKVQSHKRMPKGELSQLSFPALKIKVGFAAKGTDQEKALQIGKASNVIEIDISFNETITHTQILLLADGRELLAYGLLDLIGEKFRALLQQKVRKRNRRQDIYDLQRLISSHEFTAQSLEQLHDVFLSKCASRHIVAIRDSLEDPEIKIRSSADWNTMKLEIGTLPIFDDCYQMVNDFYKSLPWKV